MPTSKIIFRRETNIKDLTTEPKITKPSRVIVEITDKCNFRCLHCFANKNDYELKVESWIKIFNNITKSGIQGITITGGEPLLYKELFTLLKQIKLRKTFLTLDTNGSLINEHNIKLIKKYFKKVRMSYYGLNRSWHANTKSKASNTETFLKTIKLLTDAKIFTQIKIPLFKNNVKNLYKIFDQLKDFNINEIVLIPILPIGRAKNLVGLIGSLQAKRLLKNYDKGNRNIKVFKWLKGKHFLIRSNGNVCLHPPIKNISETLGNAMDRTIEEIWTDVPEKYKQINKKLTSDLNNM
ncbi:MAG: radical SAM/SPASM domain-containing protein [Clostridia bacterium]